MYKSSHYTYDYFTKIKTVEYTEKGNNHRSGVARTVVD